MSTRTDAHQLFDGPIPPATLAVARFGSPELVALVRPRGETVFFRSMGLGQLKTIRLRRPGGSLYPALFTDLQLYRQQFRGWNRVAAELRRPTGGPDIPHRPLPRSPPAGRGPPRVLGTPHPPKLDRQRLTAALRGGRSVPGAVLSNGQATIAVRTR